MIVFVGAGLALAVGFVLLKVPATRNVFSLLLLTFVVALVALWYMEPVQVLLQPALLGLLLAVVAALIEGGLKRQRAGAVLTLSSPSDFVGPVMPASSADHLLSVAAGSEEPTAVRSMFERSEPVSSRMGSGR